MTKRIVLCADDYGQAEPISKAIITLIQHGRVTATSCMVNSRLWSEHARWLDNFVNVVDIGLHFNMTEGMALSPAYIEKYGRHFYPLPTVMRKALLRQLDRKTIEAECMAQIDMFYEMMGFLPRYIDSHQHVHQFPVIRDAVINVYNQRLKAEKAYVRLVNEDVKFKDIFTDFKKFVIYSMGTKALKKRLLENDIPHNQSFAGIYSFEKSPGYEQLFPQFLAQSRDGGLIMCHPSLQAPEMSVVHAAARYDEYRYLFDSQFLMDCYKQGVRLSRYDGSNKSTQSAA